MVTPLVVYSAMSSGITRVSDWYESTMNILVKALFPTSHHRYSNLHSHVCTRDPYYTHSSLCGNDLFRNISMTGSTRTADMDTVLVCLHLNFETKNSKIDMIDRPLTPGGTLGITLNCVSITGSAFAFDFIVEKMQFVWNLSYNLFPASFFTRRGGDVFFSRTTEHSW